jgi:hypothetical protein
LAKRLRVTAVLVMVSMNLNAMAMGDTLNPVIAPPRCINNHGENVQFVSRATSQSQIAAGMANRNADGKPVIYRMNYENADPAFQRFIDFHECAHHQVGHVDQPHPQRNSYEHLMNESIADCVAILRVREEADESFSAVIASLESAMTWVGFPKSSTDSRLSNIMNCYQNYGSSTDFIGGVLEKQSDS